MLGRMDAGFEAWTSCRRGWAISAGGYSASVGAVFDACKDHLASGGLMGGGDDNVDGAIDMPAGAVDDDHGAIVKVGDALGSFPAFAKNENAHGLAGEHGRLHGIGKFVYVENGDALNTSNFVQIEIGSDQEAKFGGREAENTEGMKAVAKKGACADQGDAQSPEFIRRNVSEFHCGDDRTLVAARDLAR